MSYYYSKWRVCWRLVPALVDVDWQLDVASHRFLEDGAVGVIVAFSVHRQLAFINTNHNLSTVDHTRRITERRHLTNVLNSSCDRVANEVNE